MDTFYHPVFAPSSVKEHCLHFSEKDFNATFFTVHTRQNRTLPNNKTTAQNGVTVKSNGTSRKITRRQKQNIDPLQATLCFLGGSQGEGVTKFAFVHVVSRHMKNEGETHTVFAETGRNFHIFQKCIKIYALQAKFAITARLSRTVARQPKAHKILANYRTMRQKRRLSNSCNFFYDSV